MTAPHAWVYSGSLDPEDCDDCDAPATDTSAHPAHLQNPESMRVLAASLAEPAPDPLVEDPEAVEDDEPEDPADYAPLAVSPAPRDPFAGLDLDVVEEVLVALLQAVRAKRGL